MSSRNLKPGILLPFRKEEAAVALVQKIRNVSVGAVVVTCSDVGALSPTSRLHHISSQNIEATSPFVICKEWERMAKIAFENFGADYCLLLGDDLDNLSYSGVEGMFGDIEKKFQTLNYDVVVVKEVTAPAWPSFPAISQSHFHRFGSLFPESVFTNQEADPFIFELYRRFGRVCFTERHWLENRIDGVRGGLVEAEEPPRYEPDNSPNWWRVLDGWSKMLESSYQRELSCDFIVPSARFNETSLFKAILNLESPKGMHTRFILVLDALVSSDAKEDLRSIELADSNVVIHKNRSNIGAGMSRQRGVNESHADWVLFLDDDVIPDPDLLHEDMRTMQMEQTCDGIVGLTEVPFDPENIVTTAGHHAFLTSFSTLPDTPRTLPGMFIPGHCSPNVTHTKFNFT